MSQPSFKNGLAQRIRASIGPNEFYDRIHEISRVYFMDP